MVVEFVFTIVIFGMLGIGIGTGMLIEKWKSEKRKKTALRKTRMKK